MAFRRALGQYPTGVTVIATVEADGTPRGFTANSFTSVSLDPPLLLVCVAKTAASLEVFCQAPSFSVNVLAEGQRDISTLFATQRPDKFQVTRWRPGRLGAPLLDRALAWFDCERHDLVDAGDHVVLFGHVKDFGYRDAQPLGYLRGSYFTLGLEASLVDAAGREAGTVVGAVLERDNALLLERAEEGLRVPAVGRDGKPATLGKLLARFGGTRLEPAIDFVYAVFEDKRSGATTIYFRGRASGEAPAGMAYVPFDEKPWEEVADTACRIMLKRYVEEAQRGRFAIYMGDEVQGVVQEVE